MPRLLINSLSDTVVVNMLERTPHPLNLCTVLSRLFFQHYNVTYKITARDFCTKSDGFMTCVLVCY